MELLANIPKNGAFSDYGSFNSDLAFQGDYAYAGNYDGFTVYDISNPAKPAQVARSSAPARRTTSPSTRTCCS